MINDSLGLAAELEAQMDKLAGTYACEWKATLDDPQALKRFRHFVNSDQADPNILFVQERAQIRPATEQEKQQLQLQIPVKNLTEESMA